MDLFAIATYLTLASMCCALIAGGDVLLAEEIRDKTGAAIRRSIEGALQPISIRYYIFVVGFSCISTIIVITASGGLQSLQEKQQMMALAAKSTGPFLLALIFKVLVWDYLMVIKSAMFSSTLFNRGISKGSVYGKITRYVLLFLLVVFDVSITVYATANFFWSFETYQSEVLKTGGDSSIIPLSQYFDELNIALKHAMEQSLFVINGTTFFYVLLVLRIMAQETKAWVN